jgi:hypothetical protein
MKWLHNATTDEWEAATDQWRMGVYQDVTSEYWYGWIERQLPPRDRHESAAYDSAMDARTWCQAEMTHRAGDTETP